MKEPIKEDTQKALESLGFKRSFGRTWSLTNNSRVQVTISKDTTPSNIIEELIEIGRRSHAKDIRDLLNI